MKRENPFRAAFMLGAFCLSLFATLPMDAQTSSTFGSLSGTVADPSGAAIAGAEVRLRDRSSGAERSTSTDHEGRFRFQLVAAARYDLHAEALGYRPVVHLGLNVPAGSALDLPMQLRTATPPVTTIDSVAARASTSAPPLSWLIERGYADLTGGRRLLGDVASLSPMADADGIEGLPWRRAEVVIDGARSGGVGRPRGSGLETIGLAFPARGLAGSEAGGTGFDVEMGGTGVGLIGNSARGGRDGDWRGVAEGGTVGFGGALSVGGALQRDTAHAIVGLDYQRSEIANGAWFAADDAEAASVTSVASTTHGIDLGAYSGETPQLQERFGAFTRFDWLQGDRFALTFRGSASRLVVGSPPTLSIANANLGSRQEATAGHLVVNLLTRLSDRVATEFRISGDVGETSADPARLAPTVFAGLGRAIGGTEDEPFSDSRTTPRAAGMLHFGLGAHRLKLGLAVASHRVESRYTFGGDGSFRFGDAADLATAHGAWRSVSASGSPASFRMNEMAIFLQDAWHISDAISVNAGFRLDGFRLPTSQVRLNEDWLAATGLSPEAESGRSRVAPRIGFRWELGSDRSWVLDGGAGVFNDLPDRHDIAEALTMDRGVEVRYGVGALGGWPADPSVLAAPVEGQTLSMLGPLFEGPRTQRLALSLRRTVDAWTGYVSGVYRHTDFLSRRADLNLPAAIGRDQYGRPLFGQLLQAGTLLAAAPGSNRRFSGFESVYAIDAAGFSEFRAITLGVDRVVERGISLSVNYTYAQTNDNVAGDGFTLSPFAASGDAATWADAPGDRDAPHRALVALEWRTGAEGGTRIGAVYRLRSGAPFTPGFRRGVDANADGDWTNDPAFIDASLMGMTALLDEWGCLAGQAGDFAGRNSCRTDWSQRLDVRASFRLFSSVIGGVDIVLDALDVVGGATGPIDGALLLVDRTGAVTSAPLTGVTTVPLMVNPNFGHTLVDRAAGPVWRVGVRIGQ